MRRPGCSGPARWQPSCSVGISGTRAGSGSPSPSLPMCKRAPGFDCPHFRCNRSSGGARGCSKTTNSCVRICNGCNGSTRARARLTTPARRLAWLRIYRPSCSTSTLLARPRPLRSLVLSRPVLSRPASRRTRMRTPVRASVTGARGGPASECSPLVSRDDARWRTRVRRRTTSCKADGLWRTLRIGRKVDSQLSKCWC